MFTNSRSIRLYLAATVLAVFGLAGSAQAQTAQACLAQQLRASGRICQAFARCYALAMKSGKAVDPACFSKGSQRLGTLFTGIEALALGSCLTEGADPALATMLKDGVDPMAAALTLGGGQCAGKKMGYLSKECSGYLGCYAAAAAVSSSLDPACLSKSQVKLTKTFSKAENKGNCLTVNDRATLEGMVASLSDDVFALLRGSGTTTTTTTTTTPSPSTSTVP